MEFIIRTEEIKPEEIENIYVPTEYDEQILSKLKSKKPIVLVGSRGMGKSFLFKVSQLRVEKDKDEKIIPIFVTFRNIPTLQTGNKKQFQEYMLNRICTTILRTLKQQGYISNNNWTFAGSDNVTFDENGWPEKLESINKEFEKSWRKPGSIVDVSEIPTLDDLMYLVEDICECTDIDRFIVYIDEAAHVFIPEQQAQFFSLFRDLRSPYIKCNASVYPGVTYFGPTFDKAHDAEFVTMTRNIGNEKYVEQMKAMVLCQVSDDNAKKALERNSENFTVLAYAAGGNPRTLLKSIEKTGGNLNTDNVNKLFREFYREEIWAEHSSLVDKYVSRAKYIDWGRTFVEDIVLPELKEKNDRRIEEKGESTIYFWVDRSSPESVKEALRILEYTGLIKLQANGVKATGSVIGTRYEVNIGCLLAKEKTPTMRAMDVIRNLTVARVSEYGGNSKHFELISQLNPQDELSNPSEDLINMIERSVDVLDLTEWQKNSIKGIGINTIKDLLIIDEARLKEIPYVGNYRSRIMKNSALAAMYEYLY